MHMINNLKCSPFVIYLAGFSFSISEIGMMDEVLGRSIRYPGAAGGRQLMDDMVVVM